MLLLTLMSVWSLNATPLLGKRSRAAATCVSQWPRGKRPVAHGRSEEGCRARREEGCRARCAAAARLPLARALLRVCPSSPVRGALTVMHDSNAATDAVRDEKGAAAAVDCHVGVQHRAQDHDPQVSRHA